ncbi:MAG: hypothetical protein AABY22_17300, partial [Nanoarchaeota archaeon]
QFPIDTEFVIAIGHKGDIVKQYLQVAHSNRKFIFVEIDKFEGPGTGPYYSITQCKEYLQCPFYFVSCDSIIRSSDWKYNLMLFHSWASFDDIEDDQKENYCTAQDNEDYEIIQIFNKSKEGTNHAFTGIAYIKEYDEFWDSLGKEISLEEIAPTILKMKNMCMTDNNWFDTGNEEGLQKARKHFKGIQNLDKLDEEIYFFDDYVVKYFYDENIVADRLKRTKYLGNTIPKIIGLSKNYYKYEFLKGKNLFEIENPHEVLPALLKYAQLNLWKKIELNEEDKLFFLNACETMYYDKTINRLMKLKFADSLKLVSSLDSLFSLINWEELYNGIPSNIHGDFQFSNILSVEKENYKTFKLLDWRDGFYVLLEYGDLYYDFAKLYANLLWPHDSVKNKKYIIQEEKDSVLATIEISDSIRKCISIFEKWIVENNYSLKKVKALSYLVLLNMAPLHEAPLDKHLFYYAKQLLYTELKCLEMI